MKKLFVLLLILGGLHTVFAQDNTSKNESLSKANQTLLSKLVMSDFKQSQNKLNTRNIKKASTQRKNTAKSSHQYLKGSINANLSQNNASIFVIKKGKSRIVDTKPIENKPVTKHQAAVLNSILGLKN